MTMRLGILGYPLGHTLSPAMHGAALKHLGIDGAFEVWETPPDDLAGAIARMREPECLGGSVTIPYKQAVMPLLDSLDGWAGEIGAVNCIVNRAGQLVGHNTDADGFLRPLREDPAFDAATADVLIIGAGGAARAAAFALRRAGVSRMTIANRTVERARALASDLRQGRFKPRAIGLSKDELADVAPYADLIVNGTSVGMAGGPAPDWSPVSADLVADRAIGYEIVYAPPVTPFMREVENAGARTIGGLEMLVYQGAQAFSLWTGREAPVEVMMAAAREALRGR